MIKLVENNKEAQLVLEKLNTDKAPLLASKMFVEGFGVKQDFLQFYAAFSDKGRLCAAFVKCNDRLFCLIENLYDEDEIKLFLRGFSNFNIFIHSDFSHIVDRKKYNYCILMKKSGTQVGCDSTLSEIESRKFTDIIMKDKDEEHKIRFFLNNSHLSRHGFLKNFAYLHNSKIFSIASLYSDKDKSYLCNVYTPEKYRHQGFSSALINSITDSTTDCHLICSEEISPLYKKCGFEIYSKWIEFLY